MTAFVTDGEQRATLAVVRALGRGGIPVAVGSTEATSLAGSSRYCIRRVCYPSPQERGAEFQARIFDEMQEWRIPCSHSDDRYHHETCRADERGSCSIGSSNRSQ